MNYLIAFSAAFLTGLAVATSPVTDKGLPVYTVVFQERKPANRKEKRGFKPYAKHGNVPLFI